MGSVVELIYISPNTEVLSYGKLDQAITRCFVVCKLREVPIIGAYVACTLAENNKVVPIRILNLSKSEFQISKGHKMEITVAAEIEHDVVHIQKIEVKGNK